MSQRHWETLEERDLGQLHVILDKTWEDLHPRDCFDTSIDPLTDLPYYNIEEICARIDSYDLDWFMLRARVFYEGIELGSSLVGGFLYEDARETLRDGTADDLVWTAVEEAKTRAVTLKTKFMELEVDSLEV